VRHRREGAAGAFPAFWLVDSRSPVLLLIALVFGIGVVNSAVMGTMTALLTELFPVEVRYTGVSACYQLAVLIGSGLGPLVAATLVTVAAGGPALLAGYLVLTCAVGLLGVVGLPETAHRGDSSASRPADDAADNDALGAGADEATTGRGTR